MDGIAQAPISAREAVISLSEAVGELAASQFELKLAVKQLAEALAARDDAESSAGVKAFVELAFASMEESERIGDKAFKRVVRTLDRLAGSDGAA